MKTIRTTLLLIPFALFVACDGNPTDGSEVEPRIALIGGDAQTDTIGALLSDPLLVRVRDEGGSPVPGLSVAFRVLEGTGSFSDSVVATGEGGRSATMLSLGETAGTLRGEAVILERPTQRIGFSATILPGEPVGFDVVSGDDQLGMTNARLRDRVLAGLLDRAGNSVPEAGVAASWEPENGGSVSGATAATDSRGTAVATWILGPDPGIQRLVVGGENLSTAVFRAEAVPQGKVAFASVRGSNEDIYTMNSDGTDVTRITTNPAIDLNPSWSPDGTRITFATTRDGNTEIYVMDANGDGQTNLTNHPARDFAGTEWSPDGMRILFTSDRDGDDEVYVMNADGSDPTNLTRHDANDMQGAWSPDGSSIVFVSDRDGDFEVYAMDANGSNLRQLTRNDVAEFKPVWSPDGSRIAFVSERDGDKDIYLMNPDGSGQVRLTDGPHFPVAPAWSADGSRILFFAGGDIYLIRPDGTGLRNLTDSPELDRFPSWGRRP